MTANTAGKHNNDEGILLDEGVLLMEEVKSGKNKTVQITVKKVNKSNVKKWAELILQMKK